MPAFLRALLTLAACGAASAQSPDPATSPRDAPAGTPTQRIEVTGERHTDTDERRQSTAAKIVVGREEIERHGDSTLGEILKRLPGVTVQGSPGRGGAPRLRGLGAGFTQLLIDGERLPRGVSLDSIDPEQVERIEILRAPTAETGARAIAGTINIVLREGLRKRLNDLRLTLGHENGRWLPGASWVRNDSAGPLTYNLSLSAHDHDRGSSSTIDTRTVDMSSGDTVVALHEAVRREDGRRGINANARLQWRGDGAGGQTLTLSPLLIASESAQRGTSTLVATEGAAPYAHTAIEGHGRFSLARLHAAWIRGVGEGGRLEMRASLGQGRWSGVTRRDEAEVEGDSGASRHREDRNRTRDLNGSASLKFSQWFGRSHQLVAGAEAERNRRRDRRTSTIDGVPVDDDAGFGENLGASTTRLALYAQDEWNVTPQWAAHAGLRGEQIVTRGEGGQGIDAQSHRAAVWTPLLHAVWRPDPQRRDQLRLSLTRSWRAPGVGDLLGRRVRSLRPNSPTSPDRAGNPRLQPELATGIDVAVERYLEGGGLLSASVFHRRIGDLMRTVTTLETVDGEARWVARPRNVGGATAQGIELEAKFRLDQAWPGAWPVDLRANVSVYRSRLDDVPGPDDRLERQPSATANLGADYRLRDLPLTVGASLNWTPGYTTRLSETQTGFTGRRRSVDAYVLWRIDPGAQLRLSAANLSPEDQIASETITTPMLREAQRTTSKSYLSLGLRLEMKL